MSLKFNNKLFLSLILILIILVWNPNVNQENNSLVRKELSLLHDEAIPFVIAPNLIDISPIGITGDTEFHNEAIANEWDRSGNRDGSEQDPYIISGYKITGSPNTPIRIWDTNLYFEISNNF